MIGLTPPDRWTCPSCGRTTVPDVVTEAALRKAIHAAQQQHAEKHSSPLEVALRAEAEANAGRTG